jgi:hypothetical protein
MSGSGRELGWLTCKEMEQYFQRSSINEMDEEVVDAVQGMDEIATLM